MKELIDRLCKTSYGALNQANAWQVVDGDVSYHARCRCEVVFDGMCKVSAALTYIYADLDGPWLSNVYFEDIHPYALFLTLRQRRAVTSRHRIATQSIRPVGEVCVFVQDCQIITLRDCSGNFGSQDGPGNHAGTWMRLEGNWLEFSTECDYGR